MFRILARRSLKNVPHHNLALEKGSKQGLAPKAPFQHARSSSNYSSLYGTPVGEKACHRANSHCWCKSLRDETSKRAEKLRALGAEKAYPDYDPHDVQQVSLMEKWYAKGPPPLSDYRLSFGKYKGKRLDEVPDVYFTKYLIPRRNEIHHAGNVIDRIVVAALDEHLKKNPDLTNQAGPRKAIVRKDGIAAKPKRKRLWQVPGQGNVWE